MNNKTIIIISSDKFKSKSIYHTFSLKGFEVLVSEGHTSGLNILRDINYTVDLIIVEAFSQPSLVEEFEADMLRLGKSVPLLLCLEESGLPIRIKQISEASNINYLAKPVRLNDLILKTDSLLEQNLSSTNVTQLKASTYNQYSGILISCLRLLQLITLWNSK